MIRKRSNIEHTLITHLYYKFNEQFYDYIHFLLREKVRESLHDPLYRDIYIRIRNPIYGKISGM